MFDYFDGEWIGLTLAILIAAIVMVGAILGFIAFAQLDSNGGPVTINELPCSAFVQPAPSGCVATP